MKQFSSPVCSAALSILVVVTPVIALAATPTQADFEACNKVAMAAAGVTMVSPSPTPSTTAPSTGTTMPGSPSASPSTTPASPSTTGGSSAGTSAMPADGQLEKVVNAYRDCLKTKM